MYGLKVVEKCGRQDDEDLMAMFRDLQECLSEAPDQEERE